MIAMSGVMPEVICFRFEWGVKKARVAVLRRAHVNCSYPITTPITPSCSGRLLMSKDGPHGEGTRR